MGTKAKLVWLLAPLLIIGCGDKKLAPLTDAQKAQFQRTLTGMAAIPQAVNGTKYVSSSQPSPAPRPADATTNASFQERLNGLVQGGTCVVNLVNSDALAQTLTNGAIPSSLNIQMQVTGANCPVQMDFAIAMNYDIGSRAITGAFRWVYSAQSAFVTATDIDAVNWTGSFSGNVDPTGRSGTFQFSSNGTAHSAADGTMSLYFNISATGSADQFQATGALGIVYQGFTGEIAATVTKSAGGETQVTYRLNDQPLSQDEFQNFIGFGNITGVSQPMPPTMPVPPQGNPIPPPGFSVPPPGLQIMKNVLFRS